MLKKEILDLTDELKSLKTSINILIFQFKELNELIKKGD